MVSLVSIAELGSGLCECEYKNDELALYPCVGKQILALKDIFPFLCGGELLLQAIFPNCKQNSTHPRQCTNDKTKINDPFPSMAQ